VDHAHHQPEKATVTSGKTTVSVDFGEPNNRVRKAMQAIVAFQANGRAFLPDFPASRLWRADDGGALDSFGQYA
jgi:hypothetical protein